MITLQIQDKLIGEWSLTIAHIVQNRVDLETPNEANIVCFDFVAANRLRLVTTTWSESLNRVGRFAR
jgi:hypothetical protein